MEDNALMARVQAGDQAAFEALVLRHYDAALRFSQAIVRDASLAQDAVQDSFADLYAHRALYRSTFAFATYLRALVRHKSIDILRRRNRSPWLLDDPDGMLTLPAAEEESPEARCVARAFASGLARLIDDMPPERRRMLLAYAIEGKSYRAIARESGCSVAQVKTTLHRIRKSLRQIKEEWQ